MTKVVIKGPAAGTGSYTLNAPETASDLSLELPITGTHLASAQADGMPLGPGGDPVVESGSNSDGFWTRWADGTQIARITATLNAAMTTVNFPVPFVASLDTDIGISGMVGSSSTTIFAPKFDGGSVTNNSVSVGMVQGNSTFLATSGSSWVVTGRWK